MSKLTKYVPQLPADRKPRAPGQRGRAGAGDPETGQGVLDSVLRRIAAESRCLILCDATGSMAGHWRQLKERLSEVVERLLSMRQRLQLRIVAYRDHADGARVIEKSAWSPSAQTLLAFVAGVSCDGGGDWPEAVDVALQAALEEKDLAAVVLIGDAPPHAQQDGLVQARELGARQCPVYPILVGSDPDAERAFAAIARASGGRTIPLDDLDQLYEVLAVVLAHATGALSEYSARYPSLPAAAARAVRLLSEGSPRKG